MKIRLTIFLTLLIYYSFGQTDNFKKIQKLYEQDKFKEAIDFSSIEIKKLKNSDLEYKKIVGLRVSSYMRLSDFKSAIEDWKILISLDPKNVDNYASISYAYWAIEDHKNCLAYNYKAYEINPKDALTLSNMSYYYGQAGKFEESIKYSTNGLETENLQNILKGNLLNNRGYAYIGLKQYDKALTDINQTIITDPGNFYAYYYRALANIGLKKMEMICPDLEKAKSLGGVLLTKDIITMHCGNSQPTNSQKKLTGNIQSDLKTLLPNGKLKADIMEGVLQNPRQLKLAKKFQTAMKENYDWFLEYMKTVSEGQPMPYNSKLGLTEEEYTELMGFINNVEVVSTGQEDIVIEIKDDFIRFKSHNKLAGLDSLIVDLKNNIVTFGQYKMTFADTLNITTDKNGLKSKWTGYSWKFEDPKNLDISDLKNLSTLKMIQYKFTIGRLEKNGKTYMSLKGREVVDGAKTVDFELPVQF